MLFRNSQFNQTVQENIVRGDAKLFVTNSDEPDRIRGYFAINSDVYGFTVTVSEKIFEFTKKFTFGDSTRVIGAKSFLSGRIAFVDEHKHVILIRNGVITEVTEPEVSTYDVHLSVSQRGTIALLDRTNRTLRIISRERDTVLSLPNEVFVCSFHLEDAFVIGRGFCWFKNAFHSHNVQDVFYSVYNVSAECHLVGSSNNAIYIFTTDNCGLTKGSKLLKYDTVLAAGLSGHSNTLLVTGSVSDIIGCRLDRNSTNKVVCIGEQILLDSFVIGVDRCHDYFIVLTQKNSVYIISESELPSIVPGSRRR
ncbi:hypothetical protein PCE1_002257 [Barthelona sp. PCE]